MKFVLDRPSGNPDKEKGMDLANLVVPTRNQSQKEFGQFYQTSMMNENILPDELLSSVNNQNS